MLIRNTDPVVVETVQPVVERTTIVERENWYSEPWALAVIVVRCPTFLYQQKD
jgi:hypothetical protein